MSQLIIGDIHGCYDELQALLDQSGIGVDDEIIAIGDLFDRGPKPQHVFEFFSQTPNARAIQGNHENKHLRGVTGELPPRPAQLLTRWYIGDAYADAIAYIRSMPVYLDLPDALLVHGYYEPHVPLENQQDRYMLGLTSAETDLHETYDRPWYEYYDGDKPLIVGHRDYTGERQILRYEDRVFGIDTRCVYGGTLTGVLLPEWRFISVPAHDDHWQTVQKRHGLVDEA